MALLGDGESIEDLLKMGPEQILLRWVNYQLEKAGCTERVKNFSEDIKDSKVYTNLLAQVAPKEAKVNKLALQESDLYKRAEKTLDEADKIGKWDTVWKFKNFSIAHILRETNWGDSSCVKSAILTHLEALNFDLYEFLHYLVAEIDQTTDLQSLMCTFLENKMCILGSAGL